MVGVGHPFSDWYHCLGLGSPLAWWLIAGSHTLVLVRVLRWPVTEKPEES